ncbi:MAG: CHY zinc finger protein [Cyclobacteriaceae bacterium]
MKIKGKTVDQETRCVHFHSINDVVAIKFKCCHQYYPCYQCHDEDADHPSEVWPSRDFEEKAIWCGVCKTELTIRQYLESGNACPHCQTSFNPNCSSHYHLYFETNTN